MSDDITLDDAQRVLAAQPFSVLVGARIIAYGDGQATLEIDIRDDLRQQNGYLHGGVLAFAADNALTFAAGTALGPKLLTSGFTISYLRPAAGRLLRAHAWVVNAGRRQAVCRCDLDVVDDTEAITRCAVAQGTAVSIG
jgi:uncharacterized protein (TIGR00369 family)